MRVDRSPEICGTLLSSTHSLDYIYSWPTSILTQHVSLGFNSTSIYGRKELEESTSADVQLCMYAFEYGQPGNSSHSIIQTSPINGIDVRQINYPL